MIQKTLTTGAISGLVDGLMSVGLVVMMWLYEPLLAMLAVGVMVLYGISRAVAYRLYRAANEEAIVYAARENTHFFETLRGMPSIKALVIGDRRQAAWNNYLVDHVGADLRVQKLDLVFKTINTLLFGLDRIVIIYLGARSVMSGTLTVGMLVAFLAYKDQFSSRIATLLDTLVKLTLLGLHCERVADVALAEPEEAVGPYAPLILTKGAPARVCRGAALSARGISFRYGDNEPRSSRISTSMWRLASAWRSSGRPAPGRPRCSRCWPGCCRPAAARCCWTTCPSRRSGWSATVRRSVAFCKMTDCSPARSPTTSPRSTRPPIPTASCTRPSSRPCTMRSCACRWATRRWSVTWVARWRAGRFSVSCSREPSIAPSHPAARRGDQPPRRRQRADYQRRRPVPADREDHRHPPEIDYRHGGPRRADLAGGGADADARASELTRWASSRMRNSAEPSATASRSPTRQRWTRRAPGRPRSRSTALPRRGRAADLDPRRRRARGPGDRRRGRPRHGPVPDHQAPRLLGGPRNGGSAGKRHSARLRKDEPQLKTTLVQCAWAASRKKASYPQAQYHRLRGRRGPKKAVARRASILTAAYHMLKDGTAYRDLGPDHFDRRLGSRPAARPPPRRPRLRCRARAAQGLTAGPGFLPGVQRSQRTASPTRSS